MHSINHLLLRTKLCWQKPSGEVFVFYIGEEKNFLLEKKESTMLQVYDRQHRIICISKFILQILKEQHNVAEKMAH